ncbi:MAG: bifunctional riboflavin kinase/FAD synthetase [Bacteroidales bacterium]
MDIFTKISEYTGNGRPVLTVGMFDGVHTGHKAILEKVVQSAGQLGCPSLVVTFHPHPRLVLGKDAEVKLLHTYEERVEHFRLAGIDQLLIIPFTLEFAALSAEEFIQNVLVEKLNMRIIITGHDHSFGKGAGGNFKLLKRLGKINDFTVEKLQALMLKGEPVSSSLIRRELEKGEVKHANKLLGYPYPISGNVVRGNQIGKLIGFPTANIHLEDPHKLIPDRGVYSSLVSWNEKTYKGMSNIGIRPTINGHELTVEVNIFDFDTDIYFENLTLHLIDRIRDEKKFGNLDLLKNQLFLDRKHAECTLASWEL